MKSNAAPPALDPEKQRALCDESVQLAADWMASAARAPAAMIIDRMLTFAAASACLANGSAYTAAAFREFADKIEGGLFHGVTGETANLRKRH